MNLSNLARDVAKNFNRHSPTILSVVGAVGVIATGYLAHQAGVKSTQKIVASEIEQGRIIDHPREKVNLVWRYYIAPLSVGMATVACIVTSNVVSIKRQSALIGAYALGERALATYREKMVEQLGSESEEEIHKQVIKERAEEIHQEQEKSLVSTFDKDVFIDVFSGQMFLSDMRTIRDAMDETNRLCAEEGYAPMNHFYRLIGARTTELGEHVGWNTDHMLDIVVSSISSGDGKDIFGLDYRKQPTMEYHRVW